MTSKFPSLPNPPDLSDVFLKFPRGARPLLELHDIVLRGDSPLSPGEREMIAAHVSGTNACDYCYGAHSTIASAFGIDKELFDEIQNDLSTANIPDKLKPMLAYVAKLTATPSRVTATDAQAVYDAGWDERALYDAVTVCALFNFMNRIVEGTGCSPAAEAAGEDEHEPLMSYLAWGEEMGFA
ncbi:MAG: carboxymuconolactone decarboxylase family protein [Pseudomonadales bacterium]